MPERAQQVADGRAQDVLGVDHDLEHVLDAHRREGHDRHLVLDREPREADALLPDQLVALVLVLHHLAPAAREDEHRFARLEQLARRSRACRARRRSAQEVAPDRELRSGCGRPGRAPCGPSSRRSRGPASGCRPARRWCGCRSAARRPRAGCARYRTRPGSAGASAAECGGRACRSTRIERRAFAAVGHRVPACCFTKDSITVFSAGKPGFPFARTTCAIGPRPVSFMGWFPSLRRRWIRPECVARAACST